MRLVACEADVIREVFVAQDPVLKLEQLERLRSEDTPPAA